MSAGFTITPKSSHKADIRLVILNNLMVKNPKSDEDRPLKQSAIYQQVTTVKESGTSYVATMQITDVAVEDAGKYKVIASNELGESNASISLNFDSKFVLSCSKFVLNISLLHCLKFINLVDLMSWVLK